MPKAILDLGGTGIAAFRCNSIPEAHILGIDQSEEMIAHANENWTRRL